MICDVFNIISHGYTMYPIIIHHDDAYFNTFQRLKFILLIIIYVYD